MSIWTGKFCQSFPWKMIRWEYLNGYNCSASDIQCQAGRANANTGQRPTVAAPTGSAGASNTGRDQSANRGLISDHSRPGQPPWAGSGGKTGVKMRKGKPELVSHLRTDTQLPNGAKSKAVVHHRPSRQATPPLSCLPAVQQCCRQTGNTKV